MARPAEPAAETRWIGVLAVVAPSLGFVSPGTGNVLVIAVALPALVGVVELAGPRQF